MSVKNEKKRRSAPKYWVEIKGKLYARLQYKAENGKYKVKYKPITDKRTARTVVNNLRRELETHGEDLFETDKLTSAEFALKYKEAKLTLAVFENGIKISGRKSNVNWAFNALVDFFGAKILRQIRANDLESYKQTRLNDVTRRGMKRKIATVNRELSLLRAMFNFAIQNDWVIQSPFSKAKGIISISAETERNRVLSFDEETRLLSACHSRRSHLKPILICALDTGMRKGEI